MNVTLSVKQTIHFFNFLLFIRVLDLYFTRFIVLQKKQNEPPQHKIDKNDLKKNTSSDVTQSVGRTSSRRARATCHDADKSAPTTVLERQFLLRDFLWSQ